MIHNHQRSLRTLIRNHKTQTPRFVHFVLTLLESYSLIPVHLSLRLLHYRTGSLLSMEHDQIRQPAVFPPQ